LLALAGCSTPPPPDVMPGCNPLGGDDCVTPFPSSFYEVTDPSTKSGVHVSIPDGVLPTFMPAGAPIPISPARLNTRDGFSPSAQFLVYFKAGYDASQFPTPDTLDQSVTAGSPVQVIEFSTGTRVPVMAELDANAMQASDRQAMIIRPMVRLLPATRYVIALVGLRNAMGKPLDAPGFAALRDKKPLSKSLLPMVDRTEQVLGALGQAGVARSSVTLAWDVTTASEDDTLGHLTQMTDEALAMADQMGYVIDKSTDLDPTMFPDRLREITGTFQVPWYLTDTSKTALLNLNGGKPLMNGIGTANFVIEIPRCATDAAKRPLPVQYFGHGLFGTAQEELSSAYQMQVGNFLCMIQIGTDWIGLAQPDFTTVANVVVPDLNKINIVTDRIQQAHVNAQVLTRLFLHKIKSDPALNVNGAVITDASQVYYYGISDGGIQGGTYMALSQDVTRGALNVPGGVWTILMSRSSNFSPLLLVLQTVLPDTLDEQIALLSTQSDWDYADPASFARHIISDPIGTRPAKKIVMQESINDAQVPNLATRVVVRTIGLPGFDLEQPVYGVDVKQPPLDSAYTQWDVKPMPPPPSTNTVPGTNQAHGAIRRLVELEQQLAAFLKPNGAVIDTCSGMPCVCDDGAGTCHYASP
jgi:hypothetical protein